MVSKTHVGGGDVGDGQTPPRWASPLEAQSGPTLSPWLGASTWGPDFPSPALAQRGHGCAQGHPSDQSVVG